MSGFFPFSKIANIGGGFFGAKAKPSGLPPISFNFQPASGVGPLVATASGQNVNGAGWWDGTTSFGNPAGNLLSVPNPPVFSGSGASVRVLSNNPPGTGPFAPFLGNTWTLLADPGLAQAAFNNISITSDQFGGSLVFASAAAAFFSNVFLTGGANFTIWLWPATASTLFSGAAGAATVNF